MPEAPTCDVFLGGTDWRCDSWGRGFYPDDMPSEWRLTYFNTQFSCVWLSHSAWCGTSLEEANSWVEDTHAGFRFLLEAGAVPGAHESELMSILTPRLGLHCAADHGDLIWFRAGVNLRDLARTLLERVERTRTVYLLSRDGDRSTLEQVETMVRLLGLGPGVGVG